MCQPWLPVPSEQAVNCFRFPRQWLPCQLWGGAAEDSQHHSPPSLLSLDFGLGQRAMKPLQLLGLGHLSSFVVMEPAITEEGSSVAFQVTATVRFLPAHDRRKRRLTKWSFQEAKLSAFESLLFQGYVLLAFQSYNALSFIK